MRGWRAIGIVVVAAFLAFPPPARAQGCSEDPAYSELDFWVGKWDVEAGGQRVGENRIEKILSGCALLEHWADVQGREEKTLVERLDGGGVRFQGAVYRRRHAGPGG